MPCQIQVPSNSDFPLENIPFGIISTKSNDSLRVASIIGNYAIDLHQLASKSDIFNKLSCFTTVSPTTVFSQSTLNTLMSLGRPASKQIRTAIQNFLCNAALLEKVKETVLIDVSNVINHIPIKIGDYTDFYASKEHATNVGVMFRGKDNALMPNWTHIPVGYHGRASSVVVTGTPIKRPSGLILDPTTRKPYFSPSKKMDFELEVAFIVGTPSKLGEPIGFDETEEHMFGVVLMNDWSARDIQVFEYVPLGPFLGKNFGTTISAWVVTMDALEEFRVDQPIQDPTPTEYLRTKKGSNTKDAYDVKLEVLYQTLKTPTPTRVSLSNLKYMYWSFKQQLAHHSVNGCNMCTGDLLGSGTISGPTPDSFGSLLELSWNGTKKVVVGDEERTFIEDGDSIILKGYCEKEQGGKKVRIGWGECRGMIV